MEKQILKKELSKILIDIHEEDSEKIFNSARKSLTKSTIKAYDNRNNL